MGEAHVGKGPAFPANSDKICLLLQVMTNPAHTPTTNSLMKGKLHIPSHQEEVDHAGRNGKMTSIAGAQDISNFPFVSGGLDNFSI